MYQTNQTHVYPYKLRRPGQLKDEFGDLHDPLIEVLLDAVPIFIAVGKAISSEADLSRLLRQTFKQRFGVDVSQEHRQAFSQALRRLRQVRDLSKQNTRWRPTSRRGIHTKVRAVRKLVGL